MRKIISRTSRDTGGTQIICTVVKFPRKSEWSNISSSLLEQMTDVLAFDIFSLAQFRRSGNLDQQNPYMNKCSKRYCNSCSQLIMPSPRYNMKGYMLPSLVVSLRGWNDTSLCSLHNPVATQSVSNVPCEQSRLEDVNRLGNKTLVEQGCYSPIRTGEDNLAHRSSAGLRSARGNCYQTKHYGEIERL